MRKIAIVLFVIIPLFTFAQGLELPSLAEEKISFQQHGMLVLGSWAVLNMAGSGYMMTQTDGWQYRFHQMNVFWNVVNMGIAAGGYFGQEEVSNVTAFGLYKDYADFGKILLLNAGLDLAYMATGLYMQEKAKNVNKRKDMLKGYGKSIILQGGFLLVFDAALYWMNQSKLQDLLDSQNFNLELGANMVRMNIYF